MEKLKTSVTLSKSLVEWMDKHIQTKRFASRSHAVEYCVNRIMKEDK